MKMIDKKEIREAANELAGYSDFPTTTKSAFKFGVKFAELKFEEIAIEFAKYLTRLQITKTSRGTLEGVEKTSNSYTPVEFDLLYGELINNGKELFEQFIKKRNENI